MQDSSETKPSLKEILEGFNLESQDGKIAPPPVPFEIGGLTVNSGSLIWSPPIQSTFVLKADAPQMEWTSADGKDIVTLDIKDNNARLKKLEENLILITEALDKLINERKSPTSNKRPKARRRAVKKT